MTSLSLYRASQQLAQALQASGIQLAIRAMREELLAGQSSTAAGSALRQALLHYQVFANSFTKSAQRIASLLHLRELQSANLWDQLQAAKHPPDVLRLLVPLYSKVLFASNHLPQLLRVLRQFSDEEAASCDLPSGQFVVELTGVATPHSSLRIVQAINALNQLYAAACVLARETAAELQLVSVSGGSRQQLLFVGRRSGVSALRHTLRWLQTETGSDAAASVLANQIPLLAALNDLGRLADLSDAQINQIRAQIVEAGEALLSSGVELPDADASRVTRQIDQMAISEGHLDQKTGADRLLQADATLQMELESTYLDLIAAEKALMISASESLVDADDSIPVASVAVRHPVSDRREVEAAAGSADSATVGAARYPVSRIDKLLLDLMPHPGD